MRPATTRIRFASARRLSSNIGFATFVLKIDLRPIERRIEQIIGHEFHAVAGGRADAEPIEPERIAAGDPVERQELGQGLHLPSIEHIALVLGNDERKPGDLRREIVQFDAAEICQRDFRSKVRFTTPPVDLCLDGPHFLVGNDEEITGAAGSDRKRGFSTCVF